MGDKPLLELSFSARNSQNQFSFFGANNELLSSTGVDVNGDGSSLAGGVSGATVPVEPSSPTGVDVGVGTT